jgi:hypothetical protein
MQQRWLFLQKESRRKIENFSYSLREELGNFWNFSEFVPHELARQSLPNYSLEDCFKQKKKMEDVKLILGQEFFNSSSIRFAFRHVIIWADYIAPYNQKRYELVNGIFQRIFGGNIEDYSPQSIVPERR